MAEAFETSSRVTTDCPSGVPGALPSDGDAYNNHIEALRREEYPMLKDTVFLDHAGSSLPCKRLLDSVHHALLANLYGNPHSRSTAGQQSSQLIDRARTDLLKFFNADPCDFDLVFTANATAGVKLVGEVLQRQPGGFSYAYHVESHTSLVGLRELATGHICIGTIDEVQDWRKQATTGAKLFAYPAQSNMNGSRLPLSWCQGGDDTYTLLDAAAYASTSPLNLDHVRPDFTIASLYKIFGFPDLGVLIIKKSLGHLLQYRRYFGGGTVDMVTCGSISVHAKATSSLHEQLEDGTLPVHNIAAIEPALRSMTELFGDLEQVSTHTLRLAQQLHHGLSSLRHVNGRTVCKLYSSEPRAAHSSSQGPVVSFNFMDAHGAYVSTTEVEKLASLRTIQLRTGSLCNPGGSARALGLSLEDVVANHAAGHRCGGSNDIVRGKPTGMIRLSLGAYNTRSDVQYFIDFARSYFVAAIPLQSPPALIPAASQLVVESLTTYPLKSCAGWSVPHNMPWEVHEEGLAWDREWCIVGLASDRALSQKQFPKMALIRPEIDLQAKMMRVRFVGIAQVLDISLSMDSDHRSCPTRVCDDTVQLCRYSSPLVADTFSAFLDTPCTLARFPAPATDGRSNRHSKGHLQIDGRVPASLSLSNESPILVITRASLDAINEKLKLAGKRAVHHSIFRANIVLTEPPSSRPGTCWPWTEDDWQQLSIRSPGSATSVTLEALGGCRRCQMVCIDQQSGERRPEVFLTLAKQRGINGRVLFGIHCAPVIDGVGTIRINDVVDVV